MSLNDRFSVTHMLAVYDRRLTAGEFRILAVIGAHANRNGKARPKQKTIADMLNLTNQTVCSAIAKLVAYGYLKKTDAVVPGRGRSGCEYLVSFDLSDTDLEAAQEHCGNDRLRLEPNSGKAEFGYERSATSAHSEVHREESQEKNPNRESGGAHGRSAEGEAPSVMPADFMPDDEWLSTRASKSNLAAWEVKTIVADCRDYWRSQAGPKARKTPRGWLQTINNRIVAVLADPRLRSQLQFSDHAQTFMSQEDVERSKNIRVETQRGGMADRYRQSGASKPAGIVGAAVRLVGKSR